MKMMTEMDTMMKTMKASIDGQEIKPIGMSMYAMEYMDENGDPQMCYGGRMSMKNADGSITTHSCSFDNGDQTGNGSGMAKLVEDSIKSAISQRKMGEMLAKAVLKPKADKNNDKK